LETAAGKNKRNAFIVWGVGLLGLIGMVVLMLVLKNRLGALYTSLWIGMEIVWIGFWGWWGSALWKKAMAFQDKLDDLKRRLL
jgi:hypothetical protein